MESHPAPAATVDLGHVGMPAWKRGLAIFLAALGVRLLFALLTQGTYDPDEFVIVGLSNFVAQGGELYRSVTYFHPPGLVLLFTALHPLIAAWWPSGRIVTLLADSVTAVCVWRIGRELLSDRQAVVAGLIYAVSPIAMVSSVRIGPDPIITALAMLGIVLLITVRSPIGPIGAGICLALAVWTKYTSLLYFPVYLLIAPRRARPFVASWAIASACLFAPFLHDARAMYDQTVIWQLAVRTHADLLHRLTSVGTYLLLLNPLAVIGLWRRKLPLWVGAGFCLGFVYFFTAQAYYHYFVTVVPFAALLGASALPAFSRMRRMVLASAGVAIVAAWGLAVGYGTLPERLYVSASRLSDAQQTAAALDHITPSTAAVMVDEFQYALLAHRAIGTDYFWNMNTWIRSDTLLDHISRVAAVVQTRGGIRYPGGFIDYLQDRHVPHLFTHGAIIWLVNGLKVR